MASLSGILTQRYMQSKHQKARYSRSLRLTSTRAGVSTVTQQYLVLSLDTHHPSKGTTMSPPLRRWSPTSQNHQPHIRHYSLIAKSKHFFMNLDISCTSFLPPRA